MSDVHGDGRLKKLAAFLKRLWRRYLAATRGPKTEEEKDDARGW